MRKGFTLLELLIVVIVIGILATIAIPQFLNSVEKARVAKAKNAIGLIAHAEKMYRAEHDSYIGGDDAMAELDDYIEMDQLNQDDDWDYTVASDDASEFEITAEKEEDVAHAGETITMDQDGVCGGDHTLRGPDCGQD